MDSPFAARRVDHPSQDVELLSYRGAGAPARQSRITEASHIGWGEGGERAVSEVVPEGEQIVAHPPMTPLLGRDLPQVSVGKRLQRDRLGRPAGDVGIAVHLGFDL